MRLHAGIPVGTWPQTLWPSNILGCDTPIKWLLQLLLHITLLLLYSIVTVYHTNWTCSMSFYIWHFHQFQHIISIKSQHHISSLIMCNNYTGMYHYYLVLSLLLLLLLLMIMAASNITTTMASPMSTGTPTPIPTPNAAAIPLGVAAVLLVVVLR